MTVLTKRGAAAAAATALAVALTASGCTSGSGAVTRGPSSPPAVTGSGPYPTPSDAIEAVPLPESLQATPQGNASPPDAIDHSDADAVGRGVLTMMWTFDTTSDAAPFNASVRAAGTGWLTEAYASLLRAHRSRAVPGAQWQEWASHQARTTVTLHKAEDAAKPADTATEAWRQWVVTATPHGRDRWTGEPVTALAYVRLTREDTGAAWRVDEVLTR
ncbi:hypothetical protein [Streptomyces sp. CoH17]|uniref:hypothetical protein n=1 Tax=Streptomyces sp. CoH17 TaxID=2992806 RepID=UPI00226D9EE0|nr:hypothetical protein [Streptomyces sp. CoH17]